MADGYIIGTINRLSSRHNITHTVRQQSQTVVSYYKVINIQYKVYY